MKGPGADLYAIIAGITRKSTPATARKLMLERLRGASVVWTCPLGVEGLLTNPSTPGGQDGREANPAAVHGRVQGASGRTAARGRPGAVGGRDRAGAEPGSAELVA